MGKADGLTGSRCIRREVTLTPHYDAQVTARMEERGIGRSEVIRQVLDESSGRRGRLARLEIRQKIGTIKTHCQEIRLRPSHVQRLLALIEESADEITRLSDATA